MAEVETFFKLDDGPTEREGYAAVKARANGRCEATVAERCTGRHEVTHHKAGRRIPGAHHPDRLLACCTNCHVHIHANPARSYELGHLQRRT